MISAIFVDRPRLAVVIAIVITIAGLLALTRIPVAQFPDIVPPQTVVSATFPGASAAVVESLDFGVRTALIAFPGHEHYRDLIDERSVELLSSPTDVTRFVRAAKDGDAIWSDWGRRTAATPGRE